MPAAAWIRWRLRINSIMTVQAASETELVAPMATTHLPTDGRSPSGFDLGECDPSYHETHSAERIEGVGADQVSQSRSNGRLPHQVFHGIAPLNVPLLRVAGNRQLASMRLAWLDTRRWPGADVFRRIRNGRRPVPHGAHPAIAIKRAAQGLFGHTVAGPSNFPLHLCVHRALTAAPELRVQGRATDWHTDVSCDEKPPMASMLYITGRFPSAAREATHLFADMYRAYETLTGRPPSYLDRDQLLCGEILNHEIASREAFLRPAPVPLVSFVGRDFQCGESF